MTDTRPAPTSPPPAPAAQPWWPIVLGVFLILLGIYALMQAYRGQGNNPQLFGILLLVAGASEGIHAMFDRSWSNFMTELAPALLFVISGIVILLDPMAGSFMLTLLIAAAVATGAVVRIASSLSRSPLNGWTLVLLAGGVSLALSLLLLVTWPASGGWVLGTVAGGTLLWTGFEWIRDSFVASRRRNPA